LVNLAIIIILFVLAADSLLNNICKVNMCTGCYWLYGVATMPQL